MNTSGAVLIPPLSTSTDEVEVILHFARYNTALFFYNTNSRYLPLSPWRMLPHVRHLCTGTPQKSFTRGV